MVYKISAFGALNQDSYDMFGHYLQEDADSKGLDIDFKNAGPYPNAAAVSTPGRPLRRDALKDGQKKQELYDAVITDAKAAGAEDADILCMPCMSMIGFHDGLEAALGKPILRLAEVLAAAYKDINQVGVIHMPPAKKRIEEIFGDKAVALTPGQEDALKTVEGDAAKVIPVMKQIAQDWADQGIKHILLARADAPKADEHIIGQIDGAEIQSVFGLLAEAVVNCYADPELRRQVVQRTTSSPSSS